MKENKLLEAFQEALELEGEIISLDDTIEDFDNWDSISRLSLIALLDEYFEVEVTNAEFDSLNTLRDLHDLVINKQK
jgi:acyl carrier protein